VRRETKLVIYTLPESIFISLFDEVGAGGYPESISDASGEAPYYDSDLELGRACVSDG